MGPSGGPQLALISNVRLAQADSADTWDIVIEDGRVADVLQHKSPRQGLFVGSSPKHFVGSGRLLAPSLCHPHIHLDKAFILNHPKYRHLKISEGSFEEAMTNTSTAKELFEPEDLIARGQRVIDESWAAGVTHMRAYVEVDEVVGHLCLKAGAELKRRAATQRKCNVQLCAFAQLALKPSSKDGDKIRRLIQQAMAEEYLVDAVGSTPYVEDSEADQRANIDWMIELALVYGKHLDFHLDYSVDPNASTFVNHVVQELKARQWTSKTSKIVTLAHCTRLIYFSEQEWRHLALSIGDLPVHFVGLPTSDLYMMKKPQGQHQEAKDRPEVRGTLPILEMISRYGLKGALGINNIGNAFTPQGCCDPLYLANLGVAVYQTGKADDARLLYECVSSRAKAAIGLDASEISLFRPQPGQPADFVLFDQPNQAFEGEYCIEDKVYHYQQGPRTTFSQSTSREVGAA